MNILLDVDGVLVRDETILRRVSNNITRYVKVKVPRAKNPDRLRDHLYTRYGHTGRGLTQALGIPTPDFNPYIYDRETLDALAWYLTSAKFRNDAYIVRHLVNQGHNISLFSNAPIMWTAPVANAIDTRVRIESVVGFKPQPVAYTSVRRNRRPIIMVDDLMLNLKPIRANPNWVPVHYSGTVEDWTIPTIASLDDLPYIVKYIDDKYTNGQAYIGDDSY